MNAVFDPGYRTAPAHAAGDIGAVVRHGRDGVEMVNLRWGLEPRQASGKPFTLIRAEGRPGDAQRCLVPASEFNLSRRGRRYRFTLVDGDWFYFAGIWRGRSARWAASYAILTIAAAPDVVPFHDRQMAVVRRRDRERWLEAGLPPRPLERGSFVVEPADAANDAQPRLAL